MRDRRVGIGVVLGLLAAVILFTAAGPAEGEPAVLLPDCGGPLREIVIQYVSEAAPIVTVAYREFLGALPADVTVRVVCPDAAAFDHLVERIGPVRCRLEAVPAGHAMTTWSRDRWIAVAAPAGRIQLVSPHSEEGAGVWPARAGDSRIGDDLAAAFPGRIESVRVPFGFDGGDFVADTETVFVTPRVVRRNGTEGIRESLEAAVGRRVVILDRAPDHHAGMFLMPVGDGRVLVADPSLARSLFPSEEDPNPAGSDFSPGTQALCDAVAEQCAAEGYEVVRMPVVPGRDGRTWLTPLNAILSGDTVYMPTYRSAPALNRAAARVWEGLGYEVRGVDCTATFVHFGSLRCLVNVLRREAD